jgi:hypothetical protein
MASHPHTPEPVGPAPALSDMPREELERVYESLRREYNTTIRVLTVLVERVLSLTSAEFVFIDDSATVACADLQAWRDDARRQVILSVTR